MGLGHFKNKHILVVEDDFLISEGLRLELEDAGAIVLGPVATVARAIALIRARQVDGALLDIGLNEETSISLVNELQGRNVPFVFVSGIPAMELPEHFRAFLVGKPTKLSVIGTKLFSG